MNVVTIPIDSILVGDRLRDIDEDYARLIADSMEVDGQRSPIEVRKPIKGGKYRLISGGHRVHAARILEWRALQAVVKDISDDDAAMLEIDENLMRRELSELDRGAFLAARDEIYKRKYPQTKQGVNQHTRGFAVSANPPRFAENTSGKLKLSESTIYTAIRRHKSLHPDARALLAGSKHASNGRVLDEIGRKPLGDQADLVRILLHSPENTTVAQVWAGMTGAPVPLASLTPHERMVAALERAWDAADPEARQEFLAKKKLRRKV